MKQMFKFVFWVLAVPFIALLKNPDDLSAKHHTYLANIKLPRSTAILAMICVALGSALILAKLSEF